MPSGNQITYAYNGEKEFEEIGHFLISLLGAHFDITLLLVSSNPNITIGTNTNCTLVLHENFKRLIKSKQFDHEYWFKNSPILYQEEKPDFLGTIFYMINSLQEYGSRKLDQYNRFEYSASYQEKYKCVTEDLVSKYLEELRSLFLNAYIPPIHNRKSTVFLSHDMDRIRSAPRTEIGNALKKFQGGKLLSRTLKALSNQLGWNDTDYFMNLHEQFGFTSTFFWLVQNGQGDDNIANADYNFIKDISSQQLEQITSRGFHNGLHKASLDSSTFNQELKQIKYRTTANRNHFLRMQIPDFYEKLSESEITFDSSLCFSDHAGFRNNYGKAFIPFDLESNTPYNFVEYPLQLMDVTLCLKMFGSPEKAWPFIESFLEQHQYNCDLSVLWHNNYITNGVYQSWHLLYKRILKKLNDLEIQSSSPQDILNRFPHL